MEKSFQISLKIDDPQIKYVLMARSRGIKWGEIAMLTKNRFGTAIDRQWFVSKLGALVMDSVKYDDEIAMSAIREKVGIDVRSKG